MNHGIFRYLTADGDPRHQLINRGHLADIQNKEEFLCTTRLVLLAIWGRQSIRQDQKGNPDLVATCLCRQCISEINIIGIIGS